ncbi:Flp family type IVb pilin [Pseudovibrio exalbescens]|uniref:Flp/Fap pilin component n=1 Tax=Pseudovibrio exalbescens TaxID=197461 RepID=A0A1U7JHF7_9HYPH|nr:Flp family type IVb pilin [Pseudovibrio exalbescens]OKL44186.1 hypothetical protein A3843_07120 [Pseudovibrio exalbescens]
MRLNLKAFLKDRRGSSPIEYALIGGVIALALITMTGLNQQGPHESRPVASDTIQQSTDSLDAMLAPDR